MERRFYATLRAVFAFVLFNTFWSVVAKVVLPSDEMVSLLNGQLSAPVGLLAAIPIFIGSLIISYIEFRRGLAG